MTKIRPLPAVISLIVSLITLLGGWYVYQWTQIRQPMEHMINQVKHVSDYQIDVAPRHVSIALEVTSPFSLNDDYMLLLDEIQHQFPKHRIDVNIAGEPDDTLLTTWHELYFTIAEAMANHEYSLLSEQLQEIPHRDVNVEVAMDPHNLYVLLYEVDGEGLLFRSLSLKDETLEGVRANG